jgi:hypothetical protein
MAYLNISLFSFNDIYLVTTESDMVIYNTRSIYNDEGSKTGTTSFEFEINNSVPIHPLSYIRRDKRSTFPGRPPGTVVSDPGPVFTQEFNYSYTGLFSEGSCLSRVSAPVMRVTRVSTVWISSTPRLCITHDCRFYRL